MRRFLIGVVHRLRFSERTDRQIARLMALYACSATEIISRAVEDMYRREIETTRVSPVASPR